MPALPHLRDIDGWGHPRFWRTIQVVKLGTKLYVWGRGAVAFHLFSFCTVSNSWSTLPGLFALGDNAGWSAEQYNDTLQLVVVGHKLYIWGRGSTDCVLFYFDTITSRWVSCIPTSLDGPRCWLSLPDAAGWDRPQHYHTARVVTLGPVIYVWVRGILECQLHSFDTRSWRWEQLPSLVAFLDQDGWDQPKYYTTIQVRKEVAHARPLPGCRSGSLRMLRSHTPLSKEVDVSAYGLFTRIADAAFALSSIN